LKRIRPKLGWPFVDGLSLAFAESHFAAELALIEATFGNRERGERIARLIGITSADFQRDDLRIIWIAIVLTRHRTLIKTLMLAREGLREYGFYDPTQIEGNYGSMLWSDETLAHLACARSFSDTFTFMAAEHLHELSERRWLASQSFRQAFGLMNGTILVEQAVTGVVA
jgi:hypothetical protein